MKRCAALALCAAALAPGGLALKVAEARAQAWLRQHRGAPQQDELAELRAENPEAYGLVKALLMKRSLGLLDPRHPTASFAAAPPQEGPATPGAEAFEKIAEESGEKPKAAPLYADAPVASHQNWLSWKPQQSAMDDEAMVKNVLGAVAELKGGASLRGAAPAAEAPEVPPQPQPRSADPAPAAQENSYLAGLNLDGESAPAAKHSAGLSALKTQEDGTNYLASFSWDDGAKAAPEPQAPEPQAQAPTQAAPARETSAPEAPAAQPSGDASPPAAPAKKNALLAWLGGEKPAAVAPVAAKPTQAGNSYIMDLA